MHERIDYAAALIAAVLARSSGIDASVREFLMRWDPRPIPGYAEQLAAFAAAKRLHEQGGPSG